MGITNREGQIPQCWQLCTPQCHRFTGQIFKGHSRFQTLKIRGFLLSELRSEHALGLENQSSAASIADFQLKASDPLGLNSWKLSELCSYLGSLAQLFMLSQHLSVSAVLQSLSNLPWPCRALSCLPALHFVLVQNLGLAFLLFFF